MPVVDHHPDGVRIGDVRPVRLGEPAVSGDLLGDPLRRVAVDVTHHPGALGGESDCGGLADFGAATGDQSDPVRQQMRRADRRLCWGTSPKLSDVV